MRFSQWLAGASLLAPAVLAAPMDGPALDLVALFQQIDADAINIGTTADAVNGDSPTALDTQAASDKLAGSLTNAIGNVTAAPSFSADTVAQLQPLFAKFSSDTKVALDKLAAKKDLLEQVGVHTIVLADLKQQALLGNQLNQAILAKLPVSAQSSGAQLYAPIKAILDQGLSTWADPTVESVDLGPDDTAVVVEGQAAPAPKCPDVHLIVARGSAEAPGYGLQTDIVRKVRQAIPDSTSEAIIYPAGLFDYDPSVRAGYKAVNAALSSYVQACPKSKILLAGYSQGAQIIGDTLCGGGGDYVGVTVDPIAPEIGSHGKS
jgi:hypothetical protein